MLASASLASLVPWAASAARRVNRLQRHVQRLLLDTGRLGGEAQLLQRLDPHADLVSGLADRIRGRDRTIDQGAETADGGDPGECAAQRADAGTQQLGLTAAALEPARSFLAARLDPLQALIAALADRDQLGFHTAAALDRKADGVCLRSLLH